MTASITRLYLPLTLLSPLETPSPPRLKSFKPYLSPLRLIAVNMHRSHTHPYPAVHSFPTTAKIEDSNPKTNRTNPNKTISKSRHKYGSPTARTPNLSTRNPDSQRKGTHTDRHQQDQGIHPPYTFFSTPFHPIWPRSLPLPLREILVLPLPSLL